MALLDKLRRKRPVGNAYLPATDPDGDASVITVTFTPGPKQMDWATHESKHMRAAYLIDVMVRAGADVQQDGYKLGWTLEEGE